MDYFFICIYFILLIHHLPFEYQGTQADPATFLSGRELMLTEEYSMIRNLLFFLATPFEWLFYLFILLLGLSKVFETNAKTISPYKWIQNGIYLIWLSYHFIHRDTTHQLY